jgi:ParB family chromosome partitioning protein
MTKGEIEMGTKEIDLGLKQAYDELFMDDAGRAELKLPKVQNIALSQIDGFEDHPFKIKDDEEMKRLVESIRDYGVLIPALARPKEDGRYELISGHRRKAACEVLGIETLPVIVREMSREEAVIAMVDSNVQREHVLPSEKAFAYKMKLEAIKRSPGRPKNNSRPMVGNYNAALLVGENANESDRQVQRYIRLTELIPELLTMVDENKIAFRPAVEISYLKPDEQAYLLETIRSEDCTPSLSQAQRLKKISQDGLFTKDTASDILAEEKPNQKEQLRFPVERLRRYFPRDYTPKQMEDTVERLLADWQKKRTQREHDGR